MSLFTTLTNVISSEKIPPLNQIKKELAQGVDLSKIDRSNHRRLILCSSYSHETLFLSMRVLTPTKGGVHYMRESALKNLMVSSALLIGLLLANDTDVGSHAELYATISCLFLGVYLFLKLSELFRRSDKE